jgi:hypothetical protein
LRKQIFSPGYSLVKNKNSIYPHCQGVQQKYFLRPEK